MHHQERAFNQSMLPTLTILAVGLLALLFVIDDDTGSILGLPLGQAALGIAGLVFVAAALMLLGRATPPVEDAEAFETRLQPWLFEGALWVLALAFVVRLVGIAGG